MLFDEKFESLLYDNEILGRNQSGNVFSYV